MEGPARDKQDEGGSITGRKRRTQMLDTQFKKEAFKQSVEENVKKLYRKTIDKANEQEVYQAVCYAVKDVIMDNWLKTQNAMDEEDPKMVYYFQVELSSLLLSRLSE